MRATEDSREARRPAPIVVPGLIILLIVVDLWLLFSLARNPISMMVVFIDAPAVVGAEVGVVVLVSVAGRLVHHFAGPTHGGLSDLIHPEPDAPKAPVPQGQSGRVGSGRVIRLASGGCRRRVG